MIPVSVIIPTYRRLVDLGECLEANLAQSVLPVEVVVVDNDQDGSARQVLRQYEGQFQSAQIALHYQVSPRNSLPAARNLGVRLSRGALIVFFDDDFLPEAHYLQVMVAFFESHPQAWGGQGYARDRWYPTNWRKRLFFLSRLEPDECRVMPSIAQTYPLPLTHTISCEWLTGCNAAFRRTILDEFQYDENLLKYAFGEDLDLSYRIFQRYPNSLFLVPQAQGWHKVSVTSRARGQEYYSLREVYRLYLFYKLFQPTLKNQWVYWWSLLGHFLEAIWVAFREGTFSNLPLLLHAYGYCIQNAKKIERGNLEFFNSSLVG